MFLIALASVAYLAGFIITGRVTYGRIRPATVPLCTDPDADHAYRYSGHSPRCRARFASIRHDYEAVWATLPAAVAWPAFAVGYFLYLAITAKPRETEPEREARLAKLTADNDRREAELRKAGVLGD